jgi:hypothetical protein
MPAMVHNEAKINEFLEFCNAQMVAHYQTQYPNLVPDELVYKVGKKYIKIIQRRKGEQSGSAWAFIHIETGQIYKPASWNTPAAHARGTIFDENYGWGKSLTVYGPAYLR